MLYKFPDVLIIISMACSLVAASPNNFLKLPEPGAMVNLSQDFEPMLIKSPS